MTSTAVALAATTVLTISGHTLVVNTPMEQELQGSLCAAPAYSCQKVEYRSSGLGSAPLEEAVEILQSDLAATPGRTIVLAYSQGGGIATDWLIRYGATTARQGGTNPDNEVELVLLGSPNNGVGGLGPAIGSSTKPATPTDTGYTVIEVSREYDLESDYPVDHRNRLAVRNAKKAYWLIHTDYTGVDLYDPNNLVMQKGGTTYVLVHSEVLPLLTNLSRFGLDSLVASLDAVLRPMVDAGYDRSGYVTLGQAIEDGWDLPDVLTGGNASAASSTALRSTTVRSAPAAPPTPLIDTGPTGAEVGAPATENVIADDAVTEDVVTDLVEDKDDAIGDDEVADLSTAPTPEPTVEAESEDVSTPFRREPSAPGTAPATPNSGHRVSPGAKRQPGVIVRRKPRQWAPSGHLHQGAIVRRSNSGLLQAHRLLDEVKHGTEASGVVTGREPRHQAVEHQLQVGTKHLVGHIAAQAACLLLAPQSFRGGR